VKQTNSPLLPLSVMEEELNMKNYRNEQIVSQKYLVI